MLWIDDQSSLPVEFNWLETVGIFQAEKALHDSGISCKIRFCQRIVIDMKCIGIGKIREITNDEKCRFVLWVGNKRLIKRRLFDQYIESCYSV